MRKCARTDLCGGRPAMVLPTATTIRWHAGYGILRIAEAPLSIGAYPHVKLRTHSKIDARVPYLTPSEAEAWKSANQKIPKRRSSKRHQHRAGPRLQSTFKLLILRARSPFCGHNKG
jgi:hypothetical protein